MTWYIVQFVLVEAVTDVGLSETLRIQRTMGDLLIHCLFSQNTCCWHHRVHSWVKCGMLWQGQSLASMILAGSWHLRLSWQKKIQLWVRWLRNKVVRWLSAMQCVWSSLQYKIGRKWSWNPCLKIMCVFQTFFQMFFSWISHLLTYMGILRNIYT